MAVGLTFGAALGHVKSFGPWAGLVALAFYVGADRRGLTNQLDNLARTDTVNMATIHRDLLLLKVGQDSLVSGQHRLTCYILKGQSPECQ